MDLEGDTGKPIRLIHEVHELVVNSGAVYVDGKTKTQPEHTIQYTPKKEELPARSMKDSLNSAVLKLSQGGSLQNKYTTINNQVRRGRLLEDLDMFAVWTCMQHAYIPKLDPRLPLPYVFVTISVQEIAFTEHKSVCNHDIYFYGHVSWVGTTSMEVISAINQVDNDGKRTRITDAIFLIAARNHTNETSLIVNPLVPGSENEKKIYDEALKRKNYRQEKAKSSLILEIPTQKEQKILHKLFRLAQTKDFAGDKILPKNCRWMAKSYQSTTIITHPDHKNAQNTIFGGFLLRNALEISWSCAYLYSKNKPILLKVCDVSFRKPVLVFSLLKILATVVYTHDNYITIKAVLKTADTSDEGIDDIDIKTTNVFFCILKSNAPVPQCIPITYHENLWYLEGRRQFCYAMKLDCKGI